MEKLQVIEESFWDIKKIGVFVVILGVGIFGLKTLVLDKSTSESPRQVQGVSAVKSPAPIYTYPKTEIKKNVEEKLSELRNDVNNINVVDIATSTPAVQKFLNDFKNLQNLPQNQAKQACFNICEGL